MKSERDIQRAHDMLVGIILEEIPFECDADTKERMNVAATVLCWILEHEHNPTFKEFLESVEQLYKADGYTLEKRGEEP